MPVKSDQTAEVTRIRDRIAARFGIYFPENRLEELARKLKPAVKQAGFGNLSALLTVLHANTLTIEQQQVLIQSLTVGETYFFREAEAIEALGRTILPSLFHKGKKQLRLWCAGCATGEEPYSIAMYLLSTLPNIKQQDISLLATDINGSFLDKAAEAIYSPWSFRTIPKRYRGLYFRDIDDKRAEVITSVRDMVTFRQLNLVEDTFPVHANGDRDLDVIFCRNVLMYFEPEIMRAIIRRFARALTPDGWLVVSQTECCDYFTADFDAVQSGGITLYRRKGARCGSAAATATAQMPLKPEIPAVSRSGISAAVPAGTGSGKTETTCPEKRPEPVQPAAGTVSSGELLQQARQLADSGRLEEACARCAELIAADSLNFDGHMLYAAILQETQKFAEARATLRKALYLKPDFVMGYYSLGIVEHKLGNRREALRNFDTAARMLTAYEENVVLPEMGGLTAGRLKEFLDMARKQ